MSAPLNASATTVGALLSGSTFEIPAYQREYAWETSEVQDFWRDLSGALEEDEYFLGLIIITGEEKRKHVVDGQQRLLTVELLAAALRHKAIEIGRSALADRIAATLLRSMDYTTDDVVARIRLTDDRADKTLQAIIDVGRIDPASLEKRSSSERLWKAYEYLAAQIAQGSEVETFRTLGLWAEFISERLYVAVFEHPDEATAYSVFEVVNTRGRELTTADLLKNYVLRHTEPAARMDRYLQWSAIAREFEQVGGGQGFVPYIRHVVNLSAGYVLPKDLYRHIAQVSDRNPDTTVNDLMAALDAYLPLYLQLLDPTFDGPADPEALGIFVALNELGIAAVRPLMLAIESTPDPVVGMTEVLRLIVKRMAVGNLGAGSVERRFADAAATVQAAGSWQPGVDMLRDMDHPRQDFVDQLVRRSYNRAVLTFIRRSIVTRSITPASIGTLQYIRPRKAESAAWSSFTDEEATFWASTLGNTILVDVDRRPPGAGSWTGAKERLLLPHAIPGEFTDLLSAEPEWTAEVVARVGGLLAEAAADVWY
ncbi:DUF262 domain-containing protein [Jiangella alkaliphila]|uniref:GmrSD restriction endonucleases N-terminal domain-containing protein n=1 Tax=Jiangella alkaliphila TaxID=419479 RepID=A0A1H2IWC0_9ACTN|nr:DUF262 domain-containing protein [Jiangella alkaliphila]SDU48225.1 Protein of unknown function DUF262 [Jiangella alkaliphila]